MLWGFLTQELSLVGLVRGNGDFPPRFSQSDVLLVRVDLDAGQECAVELPPHLGPSDGVDRGSPPHEVHGLFVGLLNLLSRLLGLGKPLLGVLVFLPNPVLLTPEQVEGDGIGVGHLDQLAALNIQAGEPLPGASDDLSAALFVAAEHLAEVFADRRRVQLVEAQIARPVARQSVLDVYSGQVGEIAGVVAVTP